MKNVSITIFGYLYCRIISRVSRLLIRGFKVKIAWMLHFVFYCQFIDVSERIKVSVLRMEEYEMMSHPNRHFS